MANQCIAELHGDTKYLISEISRLSPGTTVTFEDHFTKWLKKPIRNRGDLPTFGTVIKHLRDDYAMHLSSVPGVGYKILSPEEAVNDDGRIDRVRAQMRTRKKELAAVDPATLSDAGRTNWVLKTTHAHFLAESASTKSMKKIGGAVNGQSQPLALTAVFEALKHNI